MIGTEEKGLLRAIIDRPDDDLPRLVFADWLDEHADDRCPRCDGTGNEDAQRIPNDPLPCRQCSATGLVLPAARERAEFIRVGCELAGLYGHDHWGSRRDALRQREWELWTGFGSPYERSRLFGLPPNWLAFLPAETERVAASYMPSDGDAVVRRGFVGSVTCTLETFVGGQCRQCQGTGFHRYPDFEDGEPNYSSSASCGRCKGIGELKSITPELFASQPIIKVVITDVLEPGYSIGYGEYKWNWRSESIPQINEIAKYIAPPKNFDLVGKRWLDKIEAMEAFYLGCLNYGRSVANIYENHTCKACSGEGCAQHGHGDRSKMCDGSGQVNVRVGLNPIPPRG